MKNIFEILVLVGIIKAGDTAITAWTQPSIATASGVGTQSVKENHDLAKAITTFAATGTGTVTYSLVTAVSPFAVATTGELTITAALDFETKQTYTLEIAAVDSDNPKGSGTATVTITVTDVNEAPAFAKTTYTTTIADSSTAGTTVFTASATDQDSGDTITYSIASGDTDSHFVIGSTTGIITVNTGVTLVACTKYALQVKATDDDATTSLTGTAIFNIEVTPCSDATTPSSGAAMIVVSTALIHFAAVLALLQ